MNRVALFLFFAFNILLFAQNKPTMEPLFGANVEQITAVPVSKDTTRVFVTTHSQNVIYYTDIYDNENENVTRFDSFKVVPDFDFNSLESCPKWISVDDSSHFLFGIGSFRGLWKVNINKGSLSYLESKPIDAMEAINGYLFYLNEEGPDDVFYYAKISKDGEVGQVNKSYLDPHVPLPENERIVIAVHPINRHVYVFVPGSPPHIYKSTEQYDSFQPTTYFKEIRTSYLNSSGKYYFTMGIAPDGRIFTAFYDSTAVTNKYGFAYTDFDGDPWTISAFEGNPGKSNFSFAGQMSFYYTFYGKAVSVDNGNTWRFTNGYIDGSLSADKNIPGIAFVRTSRGIGIYNYSGNVTDEANKGLRAVRAFDVAVSKNRTKVFLASDVGVWFAHDYNSSSPKWESPVLPRNDSNTIDAIAINDSGTVAYVGNNACRIYRYDSSYGSPTDSTVWKKIFDAKEFASTDWEWKATMKISAIVLDPYNSNRIFVGLYNTANDENSTVDCGALFVVENTASGWSIEQITNPNFFNKLDVNKILAVKENEGTVLYVGVKYNPDFTPAEKGIYKIQETSAGNWEITEDLILDSGQKPNATISDITKSSRDTIYACGQDVFSFQPVVYKKAVGDSVWKKISTSALAQNGYSVKSIAVDNAGNVYASVKNYVYELESGGSQWNVFYNYGNIKVNFLYFDDLLVGTEIGLFKHYIEEPVNVEQKEKIFPSKFELSQNYPNPFGMGTKTHSDNTRINFNLPSSGMVTLNVYDVLGRKISTLVRMNLNKGIHSLNFNAKDLPSGIYFYELRFGKYSTTKKMMIIK